MTRTEYQEIAEALRGSKTCETYTSAEQLRFDNHQHKASCEAVADYLARKSRAFDRKLFLKNCGIGE